MILGLNKVEQPPANRSPQPRIEQHPHSEFPSELQRFEAALWDQRNEWSIRGRSSGMFGTRALKRDEADRALRTALASLGGDA